MLTYAQQWIWPAAFCALICFIVLRAMAMLYVGSKPGPSKAGAPGHDLKTEWQYGSNRVQYVFDPGMTAYWNKNNG